MSSLPISFKVAGRGDEQRHRKQSRARGVDALEKGTLFSISKKARTLKFSRLPVFIKSIVVL